MTDELNVLRLTIHRYRRLYLGLPLFAGALALMGRLPQGAMGDAVAIPLTLTYVMILIFTLAAFANPDADLAGDAPALPAYLLRLPVPTRTLALPPLLGAALWPAAGWFALAVGFLIPRGYPVSPTWPTALFASIGPTLMAIQWAPLRSGRLRLALSFAIPTLLVSFGLWHAAGPVVPQWLTAFYVLATVGSGGLAWAGLSVSRTTNVGRIERVTAKAKRTRERTVVRRPLPPFPDALASQRWLEWRRQGRILPLLTAVALGLLSLPLVWEQGLTPANMPGDLQINLYVLSASPMMPWIPLLFASVIGMGARRSEARGADGAYHLFFATRPVESSTMIRAKTQAGVMATLAAWGITITVGFAWLWLPAQRDGEQAPLLAFLATEMPFGARLFAGLGILTLIAWTWRNQAVGAFVDFLPSRLGKRAYCTVVPILGVFGFTLFNMYGPWLAQPEAMPWINAELAVYLATKVAVAFSFARKVARLRPDAWPELRASFRTWLLGASVGSVLLYALAYSADGFVRADVFVRHISPFLAAFILMPLVRPLAGRWALEVGRHG